MIYRLTKFLARSALFFYFRKIFFQNADLLNEKGPLLLACNHSNSFLDAIILGAYFKHPVHFLARGDAFKNPVAKKILTALHLIPIYRLSEGKEYLALNDNTFERCTDILLEGGIVLIFSEGLCENLWKLRPLKKGTARIALGAWKQPSIANRFRIIPATINYSSFTRFRKRVIINLAMPIVELQLLKKKPEGEAILLLNKAISTSLEQGLISEDQNQNTVQFILSNGIGMTKSGSSGINKLKKQQFLFSNRFERDFNNLKGTKRTVLQKRALFFRFLLITILFIPALIGFLLHLPLYFPLNNFIRKKTAGTVFYHSALFGLLMICYPAYALLVTIILAIILKNAFVLLTMILMPLTAVVLQQWMDYCEEVINFYLLHAEIRKEIAGSK